MTFMCCLIELFQAMGLISVSRSALRVVAIYLWVLSYDSIDKLSLLFAEYSYREYMQAQELLVKINSFVLLSCPTSIGNQRLRNDLITFAPWSLL